MSVINANLKYIRYLFSSLYNLQEIDCESNNKMNRSLNIYIYVMMI